MKICPRLKGGSGQRRPDSAQRNVRHRAAGCTVRRPQRGALCDISLLQSLGCQEVPSRTFPVGTTYGLKVGLCPEKRQHLEQWGPKTIQGKIVWTLQAVTWACISHFIKNCFSIMFWIYGYTQDNQSKLRERRSDHHPVHQISAVGCG